MKYLRNILLTLIVVMISSCSKEGIIDNSIWMSRFTANATNITTGETADLPAIMTVLFSDDCNDVKLELGIIDGIISRFQYTVNWSEPLHAFTLHRRIGDATPLYEGLIAGDVMYLTSASGKEYKLVRQ